MKKFIAAILCAAILVGCFCACGGEKKPTDDNTEKDIPKIVTTVFPAYDFARQIAGKYADITMILPFGAENHSYEPTLSDIKKINECDIFIYVGGNTDAWALDALEKGEKKDRTVISLTDICNVEMHSHTEDEIHEHDETSDEHVWTSLKNAAKIVEEIKKALSEKNPENLENYAENAELYEQQLANLDAEYEKNVRNANKDILVFADRFPFFWLLNDYGLKHISALKGCTSDAEPTITDLNKVISTVKKQNIGTVFYVEFSDMTVCDKVVAQTGAKKAMLHSCHSITKEEFESGVTYLSLMRANLEKIEEALR